MEFFTKDGYKLRKEGAEWTDGDLTFAADADGWPLDVMGERLEGDYIDE